jgi:hypothetical protein
MADEPTPTPDPKPKRTRGEINRKHLDELANATLVADAAADPAYADALAAVDFDVTLPGLIQTRAAAIRAKIAKLKGSRTDKGEMTEQEKLARAALVAVISPIQTAAKRKFTPEEKAKREAYYIGSPLHRGKLKEVLIAANNILSRLVPGANNAPPLDLLPGIKPLGAIKDLGDAIALYDDKNKGQGKKQLESESELDEIEDSVGVLAGLRHQVQLAIDQAFPWRKAGVATIRKAFLLPLDQPLPK